VNKINLKTFSSIKNFKLGLEETHLLIHALEAQMGAAEAVLEFTKAKENPEYTKFKKYLEISEKQLTKFYELGFIGLFANFECFMFELTKELFKKYPSALESEKIIKFEDIKHYKEVKDIKDYFIDSVAIEKSYDIDVWSNFLNNKFKIKVFKNKKEFKRIKALNSLRNIMLHSGSKTNAKFSKEMKDFIKTPVPIGKDLGLDRKKYFGVLYTTFSTLVSTLEG
jgi:hypothetical protein